MKIQQKLKPEQITVIQDTREQTPLDLQPMKMVMGTLTTGDYSILGLESRVAVERKSLQDLVMCVGRERERFDREIKRLLAYPHRAVYIECPRHEITGRAYKGEVHPNAVHGSIAGWHAHGIPVYFCDNRHEAADMVRRFMYIVAQRYWAEGLNFISHFITEEI